MAVPTYILFVLGCLGAADILLYHSVSHGIRSHHDSRLELVVHSLRGPIYAALFVLVPNFAMQGGFFWLLIASSPLMSASRWAILLLSGQAASSSAAYQPASMSCT
jgi:hypothetical protein